MKYHLIRGGAFILAVITAIAPLSAAAATRTYSRTSSSSYQGERYSSSIQRKIRNLDDDAVEKLPIPILFGIAQRNLSKNFADPRDGGDRSHEGLDIMAPKGAYIVSPTDAVVTRTGTGDRSGKYVNTANPGSENFAYMHLDEIADGVKAGTELKAGDLIGYVGNTGNASGGAPHLHFEIRDGRTATDPYPRLTREFTLEERIDAITEIVKDADDEEEEAERIVANHRAILIAARAQGMELPKEIVAALGTATTPATVPGTSGFARDLTLGSQGTDVAALQTILIAQAKGPQAVALGAAGATGYFGPLTQSALAEYQTAVGISPASGYFGPLTRSKVAGS